MSPPSRTLWPLRDAAAASRGWWPILIAALPLLAALLAYAPAVGQGLAKDDFHWIRSSAVERLADVPSLLNRHTGFYRPVVALSFAANYAAGGLDPRGYGWTNLALAFVAAGLVAAWARGLGMRWGAALLAAALWLLNFHGIDMAVLWASGRTALLLTCFGLGAAIAASRGRLVTMSLLLLLALLSKEEAILLPIPLLVTLAAAPAPRVAGARWTTWVGPVVAVTVPLMLYLVLRVRAGAMTLGTAPPFYRFSFDPALVGRNIWEYAGRAGGMAAAAGFVAALAAGFARPVLSVLHQRALVIGITWLVCGFGLTLWLPARSSLYACFPSAGAVLAAGTLADAWWESTAPRARRATVVFALVLPFLLLPAYWKRNARWVRGNRFSAGIVAALQRSAPDLPASGLVVIHDDRSHRPNIASTFGTLIEDAVVLAVRKPVRVWVEPPLPDAALAGMVPPTDEPAVEFSVVDGKLVSTPH